MTVLLSWRKLRDQAENWGKVGIFIVITRAKEKSKKKKRERERERDRQTDRQTDKDKQIKKR